MKLRFISPTFHGIIDYSAAVLLIAGPFLLKLGESSPLAVTLSVITGFAVILVSIITKYKFALTKVIPFDLHLAIDLSVATAFAIIPFVLNFKGLDVIYYVANSAIVFLVVALTENKETAII